MFCAGVYRLGRSCWGLYSLSFDRWLYSEEQGNFISPLNSSIIQNRDSFTPNVSAVAVGSMV